VTTLGICVSELAILSPVDQKRVLDDVRAFGFTKVRFEVPWVTVQPRKGAWDWALVKNARDIARANGIELLPVLGVHTPSWAWTPVDVGIFATEAAKLLQAPVYEVWNEPNLASFVKDGNALTYVPWLKAAHDAIHATQPGARVVMAGLAAAVDASGFNWAWWLAPFGPWRNTSPETFLRAAMKANAPFDAVAYHPYSIGPGFDQQTPAPQQVMIARIAALKLLSDKPLLLTEWGYDFAKATPTQAAKWFAAQLPLMVGDSWFYSWRDYGPYRFGLVDANNVPREPMWSTVKAALHA
jgi:hypothetical protein